MGEESPEGRRGHNIPPRGVQFISAEFHHHPVERDILKTSQIYNREFFVCSVKIKQIIPEWIGVRFKKNHCARLFNRVTYNFGNSVQLFQFGFPFYEMACI